jgi:hypothetical protein
VIDLKLSTCLRQVRDQFAPHCLTGVTLLPETTRDLVSLLTVYATTAERLEGTTVPKGKGEIITLRGDEYARMVPVEIVGGVS